MKTEHLDLDSDSDLNLQLFFVFCSLRLVLMIIIAAFPRVGSLLNVTGDSDALYLPKNIYLFLIENDIYIYRYKLSMF